MKLLKLKEIFEMWICAKAHGALLNKNITICCDILQVFFIFIYFFTYIYLYFLDYTIKNGDLTAFLKIIKQYLIIASILF